MITFNCYDIDWDTEDEDGNICALGSTMTIELNAEDVAWAETEDNGVLYDMIADELSEKSGWLVKSFAYEKVED